MDPNSAPLPDPEPLEYEEDVPEAAEDGSPLVVLLHGRGSSERDLTSLTAFLPEDAVIVRPRAPFPGRPWGYGPGWAWYRYLAEDRVVEETLTRSLELLDDLLDRLSSALPVDPGPLFLGGFSQGGTTSLAWGLTRPGRVDGVINLSGFLVDAEEVEPTPESAGGLPVFWGHGREDPNIPYALAERGRSRLLEAGARVEVADHPGGHHISPEEMRALRRWMEAVGTDGS